MMRITFLVNDVATEAADGTTMLLAWTAARAGHTVHLIGLDQLTHFPDGRIGGNAWRGTAGSRSARTFADALRADDVARSAITSDDMDVLWLRYNPSEEIERERHWGKDAGILFGRLAVQRGVIVLDHPDTLAYAIDKLYLLHFPASVRPATLITRDADEVRRFYEQYRKRIVLKPLSGYGGADVFLVDRDASNLSQIVDVVARTGYIMAQEYLPSASRSDTRLLLVNGEPLVVDGHLAAFRRVPPRDDFRANISAGGTPRKVKVTERMLELAAAVGPGLKRDGIFLAGLDIVADRIVELNTISPGGIVLAGKLEHVDFATPVIELIERKVEIRNTYGQHISNIALATMA